MSSKSSRMNHLIDFQIFYGGVMLTEPEYQYKGGEMSLFHSINGDTLRFEELDSIVKNLGGPPVSKYHYRVPGESLRNGLRLVWVDAIPRIVQLAKRHKTWIELYVEHEDQNGDIPPINNDYYETDEEDLHSVDHCTDDEDEVVMVRQNRMLEAEAINKGKNKVTAGKEVTEEVTEEYNSDSDPDYDEFEDDENDEHDENEEDECNEGQKDDGYVSEYADSDGEEGYATPAYDSDDEEYVKESNAPKWSAFDPTVEWDKQEPRKGMLFKDHYELRHCLTNYAVAKGKDIRFPKVGKKKVLAKCKEGCKWRVFATKTQMGDAIQVKSYHGVHNRRVCNFSFRVNIVTSRWLAKEYEADLRKNPRWSLKKFMEAVGNKHKIHVSKMQVSRARRFHMGEIEEVLIGHYAKLWDYREELLRSNPGSTVVLEGKTIMASSPPVFDKFYCCFKGLKDGWLAGCRPIIGLDGCFLKNYCTGQLLCAVGRDGNNHMFPIAWAVVESESTESWTWFLQLLNQDIGGGFDHGQGLAFISDQQKGLLHALDDVLPYAEKRNCARHIYANFRKRFTGQALRNLFWQAAKCSTEPEFWDLMAQIKSVSVLAFEYLEQSEFQNWSRAFFPTFSSCDNVENNLSETFNAYILKAREKPIIDMLEEIRQALMARIAEKREFFIKNGDNLCPKVRKKLEKAKSECRNWEVMRNGCGGFEVRKGLIGYTVDLIDRTCSCRMYQLSGIPCTHVVAAVAFSNDDCDEYVNPWLKSEMSQECYEYPLKPVNGQNLWPHSVNLPLLPPAKRRSRGRPKTLRYKEWAERKGSEGKGKKPAEKEQSTNPDEIVKKGRRMRCTNCDQWDHNSRNCKNERVEGDVLLDKRRKYQRKRKKPEEQTEGETATASVPPPPVKRGRKRTVLVEEQQVEAETRIIGAGNRREKEQPRRGRKKVVDSPGKMARTKSQAKRGPQGFAHDFISKEQSIGTMTNETENVNEAPQMGPENAHSVEPNEKRNLLKKLDVTVERPHKKWKTVCDIMTVAKFVDVKEEPVKLEEEEEEAVEEDQEEEMEVNPTAPQPSQGNEGGLVIPKLEKLRSSYKARLQQWKINGQKYKEKNEGVVVIDDDDEE